MPIFHFGASILLHLFSFCKFSFSAYCHCLNAIIAIYAPMIICFLMRADPLRGQVEGGWDLEMETFLGTEMATSEESDIWAQNSRVFIFGLRSL